MRPTNSATIFLLIVGSSAFRHNGEQEMLCENTGAIVCSNGHWIAFSNLCPCEIEYEVQAEGSPVDVLIVDGFNFEAFKARKKFRTLATLSRPYSLYHSVGPTRVPQGVTNTTMPLYWILISSQPGVASRVSYTLNLRTHAPCLELGAFYMLSISLSWQGCVLMLLIICLFLSLRHIMTSSTDDDKIDKEFMMDVVWLTAIDPSHPEARLDREYNWLEVAQAILPDNHSIALKPGEPFYIWWRHNMVYTRVWYPFRNDALSRNERMFLVLTSLCFGMLLSTRWLTHLELLRETSSAWFWSWSWTLRLIGLAIQSNGVPKLLFNSALQQLTLYGHVKRRFFRTSRFLYKRIIGTVLGEVMSLSLFLVLFGICVNMATLVDSKTCWELFPILTKFIEVEIVGAAMSVCTAWVKYHLLLTFGKVQTVRSEPQDISPRSATSERIDSGTLSTEPIESSMLVIPHPAYDVQSPEGSEAGTHGQAKEWRGARGLLGQLRHALSTFSRRFSAI